MELAVVFGYAITTPWIYYGLRTFLFLFFIVEFMRELMRRRRGLKRALFSHWRFVAMSMLLIIMLQLSFWLMVYYHGF